MHQRIGTSRVSKSVPVTENMSTTKDTSQNIRRPPILIFSSIFLLIYGAWGVYHYQFEVLPAPLSPNQAGKRGFSEELAMQHVTALTKTGPHPVGSDALDLVFQYVLEASQKIKESAHWEVNVEVDAFHAKTGVNHLNSGLFKGKTLVYSDLKHVVLRISPKYLPEAEERAVLVSSHIDTVFSTQGAGDCSSCAAVILELARGMSQWAQGFKNSIIFLLNTGEEEGLNGAHSFIMQHPWRSTVRFFIDLEAMGIGGKSAIFQSGEDSWALEIYSRVAKYPSGLITAQDVFRSGVIKSATDFQVYAEVGGLPGLDFAYTDASSVYHSNNDKLELLKPGSLQHLGDNMLSFLIEVGKSSNLSKDEHESGHRRATGQPVFFDILGMFMVVYSQRFAGLLNNSVIAQSLIIWTMSILMGGYAAAGALGLSFLSIILTWVFSVIFSLLVAFLLPLIGSSPVPYIAHPWLVVGLFGAPALLGALTGQSLGYLLLLKYLRRVSPDIGTATSALQAERWVFKSGLLQWLCVLVLAHVVKASSSFVALVWLVSPAFVYGLIEATLTPARTPKPLRVWTLLLGSVVPVLISTGMINRLVVTMTAQMVRFDSNPGGHPVWLGNAVLAVLVSALTCLMFVYLMSYLHLSDAKKIVVLVLLALHGLTLTAVGAGIISPFTEDASRLVNVVHVVESTGGVNEVDPASYVSLFSMTPGKLEREIDALKGESFSCEGNRTVDFVTFRADYSCSSSSDVLEGWTREDIPLIRVQGDTVVNNVRSTRVSIDTKTSTRWALSINFDEIEDFTFRDVTWFTKELVPGYKKTSANGRHIIQFAGGRKSPTKFELELFWYNRNGGKNRGTSDLLRLRTDMNRVTPKVARILKNLPSWCSLFGKSTSPFTLAFLTSLPIDFKV